MFLCIKLPIVAPSTPTPYVPCIPLIWPNAEYHFQYVNGLCDRCYCGQTSWLRFYAVCCDHEQSPVYLSCLYCIGASGLHCPRAYCSRATAAPLLTFLCCSIRLPHTEARTKSTSGSHLSTVHGHIAAACSFQHTRTTHWIPFLIA